MQNDNKFINKVNETFSIVQIKINEKYRFDLKVEIPNGLSFEDLLKVKSVIENLFKAQAVIVWDSILSVAKIRVFEIDFFKLPFSYQMELKWYKMMKSLSNQPNYTNNNYETFQIQHIVKKDIYGFDCEVTIPNGIPYDNLQGIKKIIESSFQAHVYMEEDKFNGKALLKIVTKPIDDNYKFEIVKTKPFSLYFGMTHYYEQMIASLVDFPHVLVSGATGTGKSVCMQIAITNEMYIRPSTDFYFAQLTDKQDFEIFRTCQATKCITTTVKGVSKMFKTLINIMKQRNEIFIKTGVKNIVSYNQVVSNKKMNCIIVCIDEMPEFMPKTEKIDGKDHDFKTKTQEMMNKMVKQARNVGIFFMVGIQRPDLNDMLPNMKANFRVKLAFAQENSASSKVVCDNDDAVNLPKREALYMVGAKRTRFKHCFLMMIL
jgi:S-DNA-T family DNA segregation ATPase FtsK/SpoIIIE